MIFTESDYEALHALVFRPDYPGYKPTVLEIPNGDGKVDAEKKYAHVAPKYLATEQQQYNLMPYLETAHAMAVQAAELAGVPSAFMPDVRYGALRVLDYPPGAISNKHEDYGLFTLMCFRDQPDRFVASDLDAGPVIERIRTLNPQAHLGQLGEAMGLGRATPHEVLPSKTRQRSIVYFVISDHDAVLPDGSTVRAFLNERMARSRTAFKAYE